VWNLKKWAIWGILLLCIADLAFFIIFQNAFSCIMGNIFWIWAVILMIFNGPVGDVLILIATPCLLKHSGKSYLDIVSSTK
ncbi:MAG: hypothetical protein KJO61_11470, partial [Deltaproteobacteria bacterium]|nr:hypothetical protein [Deltaproteobacteria bacterium]